MMRIADDLLWSRGASTYEAAFVALHPFYFIDGMKPSDFAAHTEVVVVGAASDMPSPEEVLARVEAGVPDRFSVPMLDNLTKTVGIPVPWTAIVARLGLPDYRALNTILRTQIAGLRKEFSDEKGADALTAHTMETGLFTPNEGRFQALMEASIGTAFERTGCKEVDVHDEFESYCVRLSAISLVSAVSLLNRPEIKDAKSSDGWPAGFLPRRITSPDGDMVCVVDWDSFFTVFLGSRECLKMAGLSELFEGFWAHETTSLDWQSEPLIALAAST